ncbi:integrase core domain protein [Plakobranchus ocellatus]|uniref:Integrase core domain protein n=1 Tax=Plakobranchus ocellatus TaxID=259542 RepID=A0AAV4DCV6_9GAST|nr:integrase core domain protein [Plakobranchus ocellatus]
MQAPFTVLILVIRNCTLYCLHVQLPALALHLELVDSLSVDDFILAFRRFVARRALPSIIYSDKAKTFKVANSLLQSHFGKEIVCWKNICPLSPNWGGWKERLVKTVKSSQRKSLGGRTVNKVVLETILPEIEACVNSRPLMYIAEKGKTSTPSNFFIVRATPLTSTELNNFEQVITLSEREELEELENFSHQSQQHSPSHAHTSKSNDSEPPFTDQREEIPCDEVPKQTRPKIDTIVTRVGRNVKPCQILICSRPACISKLRGYLSWSWLNFLKPSKYMYLAI